MAAGRGSAMTNTRILTFWQQTQGTYWFVPALMVVMSMLLAMITVEFDRNLSPNALAGLPLIFTGGADSAHTMLSTIAGSMITVAGVTFSITIAALSQASLQLGPRLLVNFLRDRGNQVVLGTFVATFMYCLLVLRTVFSTEFGVFVPQVSITICLGLAVASVGVLIYFIHHVATLMQAEHVIASVGGDLRRSIERLFPDTTLATLYEHAPRRDADVPAAFAEQSAYIVALLSGYLQAVDYKLLMATAHEHDVLMKLFHHPGEFVAEGSEIALVFPPERISDSFQRAANQAIILGNRRIPLQDIEFAVNQLVEIALRAISAAINDPFTAMACLDQLSSALAELAERTIPSGYYYDEAGKLRIISDIVTFADIMDTAFNQIRQHSRTNVAVTIRLLEALTIIAARAHTPQQRNAIARHAQMVNEASDDAIPEAQDRKDINRRYELVLRLLRQEQDVIDD
jgi:uncharacterized membrane protein